MGLWKPILKGSQESRVLTQVATPRPRASVLNLGTEDPWSPPPARALSSGGLWGISTQTWEGLPSVLFL